MDAFVQNFFNLAILREMYPFLLDGLWMTVKLCLVVIPLGVVTGATVAVLYSFHARILNVFLIVYVDFFRSFPPLVLLIFVFYGMPFSASKSAFAGGGDCIHPNTSSTTASLPRRDRELASGSAKPRAHRAGPVADHGNFVLPQRFETSPRPDQQTLEVSRSRRSRAFWPCGAAALAAGQGLSYNPTRGRRGRHLPAHALRWCGCLSRLSAARWRGTEGLHG